MNLGAFSISLTVSDLDASQSFYEKLGFVVFGGSSEMNYVIMKNDDCLIGLFQGMFDRNVLTFNPGWDTAARDLDSFTDVRQLQQQLKAKGVTFISEADESSAGPASFMIEDPDGNPILFDQHR